MCPNKSFLKNFEIDFRFAQFFNIFIAMNSYFSLFFLARDQSPTPSRHWCNNLKHLLALGVKVQIIVELRGRIKAGLNTKTAVQFHPHGDVAVPCCGY